MKRNHVNYWLYHQLLLIHFFKKYIKVIRYCGCCASTCASEITQSTLVFPLAYCWAQHYIVITGNSATSHSPPPQKKCWLFLCLGG